VTLALLAAGYPVAVIALRPILRPTRRRHRRLYTPTAPVRRTPTTGRQRYTLAA
jgi:hypothetical protein